MPMKHRAVHNPRPKLRNPSPEKLDVLLGLKAKLIAEKTPPLSEGAIEARRLIAEAQLKYNEQQEKAMQAVTAQNERVKAALNEWGDDDHTPSAPPQTEPNTKNLFKTTVGVSKASFNYIRDNPYLTTMQAVDELERKGFKRGSTVSLLSQMVRQGLLSKDKDGKLTALVKEFRPLKSTNQMAKIAKLLKRAAAKKPKPKAKAVPKHPPVKTIKFEFPEEAEPNRQHPEHPPAKVNIDIVAIKERNGIRAGIATLNAAHAQATPAAEPAPTMLTAKQVLETLSIKEAHMLYRELQTMFG
jgi:hypothetical protein